VRQRVRSKRLAVRGAGEMQGFLRACVVFVALKSQRIRGPRAPESLRFTPEAGRGTMIEVGNE